MTMQPSVTSWAPFNVSKTTYMKIAQSDEPIDEQYAEVLDAEDTINESNNTNHNELQNYTTPFISVHCCNITKATKTVTFHHDVKP